MASKKTVKDERSEAQKCKDDILEQRNNPKSDMTERDATFLISLIKKLEKRPHLLDYIKKMKL